MQQARSWVEIAENYLRRNFETLKERAGGGVEVMAVVKANAYGHGAERCAVALARAGAHWFGVADAAEGAQVRAALDAAGYGDAEVLVVCGSLAEDTAALRHSRLTPVIWTAKQARALAGGDPMRVHVEVETGMGRQGCRPGEELDGVLDAVVAEGLELGGVMTHFCQAEVVHSPKTREQQTSFEGAVRQIGARGMRAEWVHAGSTSSLDSPTWDAGSLERIAQELGARPMVRCGLALYGYANPLRGGESVLRPELQPILQWNTRVLDVRELAAGETVGYDSTFQAKDAMRVALLPVGYADGLRRALSSTDTHEGGWVMIGGKRARILGRVSMNLTVVDVTAIRGVRVGDEVVLLGEGVTADAHAALAGTIAYEILCGIG